jgi:Icc protein
MTAPRHKNAEPVTGTLRIAQITDCHLSADPATDYRGQNPVTNLQRVLDHMISRQPDLLLVTGDLSEDGSAASYKTLKKIFAQVGAPALALPGNHDEPVLLAQHFPTSLVDSIKVTKHGAWQIIRLNSCLPGKPHGRLSEDTLTQFEKALEEDTGRPRLVALHHQPLTAGSPWIDKYRLMDAEPFLRLVKRHPDIKAVVWGHIHQPFEAKLYGTLMLGAPSSVANSLPGKETFTLDEKGPACRWLELRPDGNTSSEVVRARP